MFFGCLKNRYSEIQLFHYVHHSKCHELGYPARQTHIPRLIWWYNMIWLVVWNMAFMTFHILGMSSSQLTFSPSFFRGVGIPPTSDIYIYNIYIWLPIKNTKFRVFLGSSKGDRGMFFLMLASPVFRWIQVMSTLDVDPMISPWSLC